MIWKIALSKSQLIQPQSHCFWLIPESRRTGKQSKKGQQSCVVVVHLEVLGCYSLWAIQQVAFQHLVKYFVRNKLLLHQSCLFSEVRKVVLGLRAKDPHALETGDTRNEALLLVLWEVVPAWDWGILLPGMTFMQPFRRAPAGQKRESPSSGLGILTRTLPRSLHRGTCF